MNTALNIQFTIDGYRYSWHGGFGAVIQSRERGVKKGDVRQIAGRQFFAYMAAVDYCDWWWQRPLVSWVPCEKFDAEWIRNFKMEILQ